MINYTPMKASDITEALCLWRDTEGICLRDADSPEALSRYLERNPALSFVARENGLLVGVSLAGHDGRRGYLHHVTVASSYRRRGIGRELVQRCLTALKEQGIQKCHLFVLPENRDGQKFWQRLGWGTRTELILMSYHLTDSETA